MNYYQKHIGDYAAATRHLSILEHGAYNLMLDTYYTSEQPLPCELKDVCRKVGARSKDEISAVETLLKEFFVLTEAGWVQTRCDVEIAEYQRKAETNRVIGRRGGRPNKETQTVYEKTKHGNPEKTQTVIFGNPDKTLTNNHKPITNNHKINTPPEGVSESVWIDFCQHRKDKRSRITDTAIDGIRREAGRAGWSLEDALRECCSRGWTGFKADWVADKPKEKKPWHPPLPNETTPARPGPDPELERIKREDKHAAPMPANLREKFAGLTGKLTGAMQ